jgi:hypothetical protein
LAAVDDESEHVGLLFAAKLVDVARTVAGTGNSADKRLRA